MLNCKRNGPGPVEVGIMEGFLLQRVMAMMPNHGSCWATQSSQTALRLLLKNAVLLQTFAYVEGLKYSLEGQLQSSGRAIFDCSLARLGVLAPKYK